MALVYWIICLASLAGVRANPVVPYDRLDVNQGVSGGGVSGGGGAAASGVGATAVGGAGQAPSGSPVVYSPAASAGNNIETTDALVSELLARTTSDDGLTRDLFHNLAQFANTDQPKPTSIQDDLLAIIMAQIGYPSSTVGDSSVQAAPTAPKASTATATSTTAPADTVSSNHLQAAANIYAIAQGYVNDADLALIKAESQLHLGGLDAVTEAANSAKAAALMTIATAKAEARSSVVQSRNAYVSALEKLRDKITVMRLVEKRFRSLAVAFSKLRDYAGQALLSLKTMTSKKNEYSSRGRSYSPSKDDIFTTVASAKARIAKMKIVEKRFLVLAQALAKIRAQTYAEVRVVRKNAILLAKTTTAAQAQVNSAVESASNIVSQAVATARATALAKAQATAKAAIAAKSKAETMVNAAEAVIAEAKVGVPRSVAAPVPKVTSGAGTDPRGAASYSQNQQGATQNDVSAQSY